MLVGYRDELVQEIYCRNGVSLRRQVQEIERERAAEAERA